MWKGPEAHSSVGAEFSVASTKVDFDKCKAAIGVRYPSALMCLRRAWLPYGAMCAHAVFSGDLILAFL